MKNPLKYLIPAYYTALNGQITVNGTVLPVYDGMTAPNADSSYIMIGERTWGQLKAKGPLTAECFVLIDIVLKGYGYGFKDCDEAEEQITEIINSDANLVPISTFQVVTTSVQGSNSLSGLNDADNVFRKLIRFRNVVTQIA